MPEDRVAMLVGLIMDRMGTDSITLTRQDMIEFEGGIESAIDPMTNSCTITRFK
ncbi:hypothetical protein SEA_LEWANDO_68 [Arthrobacter phage Lewando]|nr:hypothetical protein SEA_LEWANDO_68 [Arthrobacter phage Lewando]